MYAESCQEAISNPQLKLLLLQHKAHHQQMCPLQRQNALLK